jgi:hypothetical protein
MTASIVVSVLIRVWYVIRHSFQRASDGTNTCIVVRAMCVEVCNSGDLGTAI